MNRTVLLGGIMIFLIVYWLIGFVNDLNRDFDVPKEVNNKTLVTQSQSHMSFNSNGNEVLLLNKLSVEEKKNLWNNSDLKVEMLEFFPHFIEMKDFVEEHIEDDGTFKTSLVSLIENIEFQYIGASLSAEKAKSELSNF